jgi:hypothetical protein
LFARHNFSKPGRDFADTVLRKQGKLNGELHYSVLTVLWTGHGLCMKERM